MKKSATISSKGQLVIPREIRKLYSLKSKTKVIFEPAGDSITIRPVDRFFSARVDKKLAGFCVDPKFKENWEKSIKKRTKGW